MDPRWQNLHALLQSFLKEHAQTGGQVRPELRSALFAELYERLNELTRIVVARRGMARITPMSEELASFFWQKHRSFTQLITRYKTEDAKQGFNFFYTLIQNAFVDMKRKHEVIVNYQGELAHNDVDAEAIELLMENLGAVESSKNQTSIEDMAQYGLSQARLQQLPPELQFIARHALEDDRDLTQAEAAQHVGISLATYKRRLKEVRLYMQGHLSLSELEAKG